MRKLTYKEVEKVLDAISKSDADRELHGLAIEFWNARERLRKRLEEMRTFPTSSKGQTGWSVEDFFVKSAEF